MAFMLINQPFEINTLSKFSWFTSEAILANDGKYGPQYLIPIDRYITNVTAIQKNMTVFDIDESMATLVKSPCNQKNSKCCKMSGCKVIPRVNAYCYRHKKYNERSELQVTQISTPSVILL